MKPYEKAKELINRYNQIVGDYDQARDSAGIAVYEILESRTPSLEEEEYWQKVRYEIYASCDPFIESEAKADQFNLNG